MDRGLAFGAAAYGLWGLFPIYFTLLGRVPALEVLGHRIVWSFLTLLLVMLPMGGARLAGRVSGRAWAAAASAAMLIGLNWYVYVWAVTSGFIVETSLGYFVTPLVNVLLGIVVFRETLRRGQWIAVGLAALGLLYLTAAHGSLPWISLVLAVTFGGYGLVKKTSPLGALQGLTLETGILFLPALAYVATLHWQGQGALLHVGAGVAVLLVAAGVVTIGPLLLFASAVRRVPLSIIGILQYIAPTIQFLLGVFLYGEPFTRTQLAGFALVWLALVVFTAEGVIAHRRRATVMADPQYR